MNPEIIEYEVTLSADLGAVLPPVGDLLKRVNDEVSSLGASEQLTVRGTPFRAIITSQHELTQAQIEKMKQIITEQFAASQPAWRVRVESFRRKSGNVQQQVG